MLIWSRGEPYVPGDEDLDIEFVGVADLEKEIAVGISNISTNDYDKK